MRARCGCELASSATGTGISCAGRTSMATVETTRTSRHNYVSAEPSPLVGRLGPWQLVRLMAEGNFTRVYQARPAEDGRERR